MNTSTSGTINSSGFNLNYVIRGEGIPVLVPGCSLYDERCFPASLHKDLRMVFVDHRGFVPPPYGEIPDSAFDLEPLLADIELARKKTGLDKFFIMGHSGHGFLAIEYAKKFPQHVIGVIMVATAPDNSVARRNRSMAAFERDASPERKKLLQKNMSGLNQKMLAEPGHRFMHFLLATAPQSWYDPEFDARILWEGIYTNMQAIDHTWGVVFRDLDITKGLEHFATPVLLAFGRHDYLTGPVEVWDDAKTKFSNLQLEIFEKSAHCPHYEEPVRFNDVLLSWIKKIN